MQFVADTAERFLWDLAAKKCILLHKIYKKI